MKKCGNGLKAGIVASLPLWLALAGQALAEELLITPSGPDVFSVNPKVLSRLAGQAAKLPSGLRLVLKNPPVSFRDYGDPPTGGRVTVESTDPASGVIHLALQIQNGETVSEVLYFDALARRIARSKQDPSSAAGEVVQTLVRSGDEVRIVARGEGFEISLPGIAQNDGGMGDLVTVINTRSGSRLRGEVSGADRIVVRMGGSQKRQDRIGLLDDRSGSGY